MLKLYFVRVLWGRRPGGEDIRVIMHGGMREGVGTRAVRTRT